MNTVFAAQNGSKFNRHKIRKHVGIGKTDDFE